MANKVSTEFTADARQLFKTVDLVESRLKSADSQINRFGQNPTFGVNPLSAPTFKPVDTELAKANAAIANFEKNRVLVSKSSLTEIERGERSLTRIKINEARAQNQAAINEIKQRQQAEQQLQLSGGGGGLFGQILGGNLAARAITEVTSVALSGGKAILDYSSNLEQATIGFETLTGSSQKAQQHIKDLQNFAETTPFEFAGLVKSSQLLQGVGIESERVIPVLTDVGNALSAAGKGNEEIQRTVLAISQITSKGKVAGQEINQLAENGISAVTILSQALGKPKAEILALSEAGQISSELFLRSLHKFVEQNHIGDAMVKQSHTFSGAMSNINDALYITASKGLAPLYEKVSNLADDLAQEVGKNENDLTKVGTIIAKSIARGFGDIIGDEIKREINDIKEGKGKPFDLTNETHNIGVAFSQGLFGKRSNPKDIYESANRLNGRELTDNLYISDIEDLETVNFFGEFTEKINKLKEQRDQVLNDLAETFKPFSENLTKGVDLNGVKVVFDPLTNTLKEVQAETKTLGADFADSAKEAKKLADAVNKFNLSGVDNYLEFAKAKIGGGQDSDLSKIVLTAEIEQLALKEKIRLQKEYFAEQLKSLTPAERNGNKGTELALQATQTVNELIFRQEIGRINANKQINEELEKQRKKTVEIFDGLNQKLNSNSPFVSVFSEADKALESLRENLKGAAPELQAAANILQQRINADSLFNARLDNDLAANDLRQKADELRSFKSPKIEDTNKFFKDFIDGALKQSIAANGGSRIRYNSNIFTDKHGKKFTTGFTQTDLSEEANTVFERTGGFQESSNGKGFGNNIGGFFRRDKTFADLTEKEKFEFLNKDNLGLQKRLSGAFDVAQNRRALNDDQQSSIDKKIIALSSGVNPEQLNDRQRDLVAQSLENEARRREAAESKANELRSQSVKIQTQIRDYQKQLLDKGASGGKGAVEVTVKDQTNSGVELSPAPTSADTANYYDENDSNYRIGDARKAGTLYGKGY